MVATIYKYTIENNLTNKREKRKKKHTRTNGMYLIGLTSTVGSKCRISSLATDLSSLSEIFFFFFT